MGLAIVAAVLVFVAVAGLILVITSSGSNRDVERRLLQLSKVPTDERSVDNVIKRDSGTFPVLSGLVSGGWSRRARVDLARAGLSLKVSEYLLLRLMIGAIAGVAAFVAFSGSGVGLLLAIVLGVVGFLLPAWYVALRRGRRIEKISSQLPEALVLIANSLRSGFAFTQSVELAVKQLESPIREEFGEFLRDTSLGSPTDDALQELSERTGSYDVEMMVSTILIQRTTGGNLSEILDNVAATIRERERLQGEIKALTASQRFTGLILSLYPIGLGLLLVGLAPSIYKVLVTEEGGRVLLVIAVILQIMGVLTIRRILRLEV